MSETGFVDVVDGRLYYEVDGAGPPLVLIAGGMMDLRIWQPQIEELADVATVIRYDPRGYGRSTVPDGAYRHCDDLRSVIDALGFDRACIGGGSLGGTIAIDTALTHPDVVDRLILAPVLPLLGWDWVEGFPIGPALRAARAGGVDAFKAAFADLPLFASGMATPEVAALLRRMIADASGWHVQHPDPGTWAAPDAVDRLAEVTAKTLVLVGGRDVLDSRLTAEHVAAELPDAELRVIDHVGHSPNLEDPALFNELVVDFLTRNRAE